MVLVAKRDWIPKCSEYGANGRIVDLIEGVRKREKSSIRGVAIY